MRTGTETASRVKDLEAQISELESGSDRLSRALDTQKGLMLEVEVEARRRMEDVEREVLGKVSEFRRAFEIAFFDMGGFFLMGAAGWGD
jgi:homeobox protein cut-like